MQITFLIGNGFDIGIGLKSKFSHYFSRYIEESKDKEYIFKEFADEIDKNRAEWSYFESKLGEYTEKFTSDTQGEFIEKLRDFELGFIKYLKDEETQIKYDSKPILEKFKKAFSGFYKNNSLAPGSEEVMVNQFARFKSEYHTYNFINFNYTNCLENCLSVFPERVIERYASGYQEKIGSIIHIHGTENNLPLMGVNDESQIKNKELAKDKKFIRFIVKPLFNKANKTNNDKKAIKLIENSNVICVYGMALGETDKDWWNLILRWLASDSNRQLVIFDYDEKYQPSSQFDWLTKEDGIVDTLSKHVEGKVNVEALRERIHIAVHKNIFALDLRKKESEAEKEVAVTVVK